MISYEPFWNTLKIKGTSQYTLINKYGISAGQLSRIRKGGSITTSTINRLCEILDCEIQDIIKYTKDIE